MASMPAVLEIVTTFTVIVPLSILLLSNVEAVVQDTEDPWIELLDHAPYYSERRVLENANFSLSCQGHRDKDVAWEKDGDRVLPSHSNGYVITERVNDQSTMVGCNLNLQSLFVTTSALFVNNKACTALPGMIA